MANYPNLFSFNFFAGVTSGIMLVRDGVNPHTQRPLPPHIAAGPAFIAVEKGWKHPPIDSNGRLHEATLHLIEPLNGSKPFEVLMPRHQQESRLYCRIESEIPSHIKLRVNPRDINARYGLELTGSTRKVIWDNMTRTYIVEFVADGDSAYIWHENGMISWLSRRDSEVISVPLTAKEIVTMRVAQFEEQILELQDDVDADTKRRHGIIGGAVRLLRYTNDREAQDVLTDFLVDQVQWLTDGQRAEIRQLLLAKGHILAGNFLSGWSMNVVPLKPKSPADDNKAKSLARKRVRAEEDRASRLAMKGSSNGGGGQKRSKK